MRSTYCGLRNRAIAWGICLCALLMISNTLSANPITTDPYTFMPGTGISDLSSNLGSGTGSYDGVSVSEFGPYAGTLTNNTTGAVSPDFVFFCLTGNQYYQQPEYGNDGPANVAQVQPTTRTDNLLTVAEQEEAAFLVSVMLTDEAVDKVTLTAGGSGASEYLVATGTDVPDFEAALGPIQLALWYVAKTLPSVLSWDVNNVNTITDSATYNLVVAAQASVTNPNQWFDSSLQVFAYGADSGGQNFIGAPAPEPGTMVLFGVGALLVGLGRTRRLLARRRAR